MPTPTSLNSFDPALKQIYEPDNYRLSTYEDRPAFGMLPKDENFGGRNMPLVNQFANPQGVSSSFTKAQANGTSMQLEDFLLTRVTQYSVATIDAEAIEASEKDQYAFLEALTAKIDSVMDSLMDVIESYIFRNGNGVLAAISAGSNVATNQITLSDLADVHAFEVGMAVCASQTAGGALRNAGAIEVVKGVDRARAILTSTSAAWNTTIAALAAGDSLYRDGDAAAGGANKVIVGFEGWLPSTAPGGGDNFFGVNRSVDSRLYGNYFDGSGGNIEEAVINGQSIVAQVGGRISLAFMNHTKFRRFKLEIGSKEWFQKPAKGPDGDIAEVSYMGIRIMGDKGPIDVMPANKCQGRKLWLLQEDTWKLASLGAFPKLLKQDGLVILRQSNADGYEVRVGARGQQGCKKPGSNGNVDLPA